MRTLLVIFASVIIYFQSDIGSGWSPLASHSLQTRRDGEYVLVGQNYSRSHGLSALALAPVVQSRFQNYYITMENGSPLVKRLPWSETALMSPDWKQIDERAVWSESGTPSSAGAPTILLIQARHPGDASYIFAMPTREGELPQWLATVHAEQLGVNLDAASHTHLLLRDIDSDQQVDLVIQRPGGLVPVYVSDILKNQSRLQVLPSPQPQVEALSLADHCGFQLKYPAGSEPIYFSRSCLTAYIPPPTSGVKSVALKRPDDCKSLRNLEEQVKRALPSPEAGGLEGFDVGSLQVLLGQLKDLSREKTPVETVYKVDWEGHRKRLQQLNENSPIVSWEKLPIERVEIEGVALARPVDLENFTLTQNVALAQACEAKEMDTQSVSFVYKPWVERTATIDYVKMMLVDGAYRQVEGGVVYSWMETSHVAENLFYRFGADNPEFSLVKPNRALSMKPGVSN